MRIIEKYLKDLKSSEHEIIQSMYNSKYKIEDIEDCKELFIFASKNFEDKYEVAKTRNALNNMNLEDENTIFRAHQAILITRCQVMKDIEENKENDVSVLTLGRTCYIISRSLLKILKEKYNLLECTCDKNTGKATYIAND